jgi:hypothetical protein
MSSFRRTLRHVFAYGPSKHLFNALVPRLRAAESRRSRSRYGSAESAIDDVARIPISRALPAVYFKRHGADAGPGCRCTLRKRDSDSIVSALRAGTTARSLPVGIPGREAIDFAGDSVVAQIEQSARRSARTMLHLAKHFRAHS